MNSSQFLQEKANLGELLEGLNFDDVDVERATRTQPQLFLKASRYRVQKMRFRIQTETELAVASADYALEMRKKKNVSGQRSLTEGAIRDAVSCSRALAPLRENAHHAEVQEEFAKLLVEAYRQRAQACRILVDAMGAETARELRTEREEITRRGMERLRSKVAQKYRESSRE